MTTTASPRFGAGLPTFSTGTDAWLGRIGWNAFVAMMESSVPAFSQGVTSARPAADATKPGRFYFATDTKVLSWDLGGTWVAIGALGGTAPSTAYPGATGSEGSALSAARADHTHSVPPVTFQTAAINSLSIAAGGDTQNLTSAINVPAVGYPRILEARLRGMSTAQSARVQWQIWNVATNSLIKAGSTLTSNASVEVTFKEILPAGTARSIRAVLVADGSANTPASGGYTGFDVSTYAAGTP